MHAIRACAGQPLQQMHWQQTLDRIGGCAGRLAAQLMQSRTSRLSALYISKWDTKIRQRSRQAQKAEVVLGKHRPG